MKKIVINNINGYIIIMANANVIITNFDCELTAAKGTVAGLVKDDIVSDATANFKLPIGLVKSSFKFSADDVDFNDVEAEDIQYWVNSVSINSYLDQQQLLNGSVVTDRAVIDVDKFGNPILDSEQSLGKDYIRYLAKELFNTAYAVDVFSNEEELLGHFANSAVENAHSELLTKMKDALSAAGQYHNTLNEVDTELGADLGANISSKIFRQLLSQKPARFQNLAANGEPLHDVPVPLQEGDKLLFTVTVSAADEQEDVVVKDAGAIENRIYKYELELVADDVDDLGYGEILGDASVNAISYVDAGEKPTGSVVDRFAGKTLEWKFGEHVAVEHEDAGVKTVIGHTFVEMNYDGSVKTYKLFINEPTGVKEVSFTQDDVDAASVSGSL